MGTAYRIRKFSKIKNREHQVSSMKWQIRDFDLEGYKLLAKWLSRQIKILETDVRKYNITLEDIGLSNRAYNVLKNNGIDTLYQLNKLSVNWDNIFMLKGAGRLVCAEIRQKLSEFQNRYIFKGKR